MSPKRIGIKLRALREKKRLTQTELAKKARITQSYLAKMETGEKQNPSLAIIQRIGKALSVPVTELLE